MADPFPIVERLKGDCFCGLCPTCEAAENARLKEALATASARMRRLSDRLPELLTGTQRAEMAIFAGHSADAIDAALQGSEDE